MPNIASAWRLVLLVLFTLVHTHAQGIAPADNLAPVEKTQLCVTKGKIGIFSGTHLQVLVPEMRAVVAYPTEQNVEAHFTYLGRSKGEKPLASGSLRRQFGLKLRAANSCNLVYVMWRIAPKAELVVSVKSNPGRSTHAQCGTDGYTDIKALPVPRPKIGDSHSMRAAMRQSKLLIWIDKKLFWEGDLGQDAMAFDGPVGVRTDNGRFKFQLLATPFGKPGEPIPCHAADENE